VSGEDRIQLGGKLLQFANQWMKFVSDKCERGRGLRPRCPSICLSSSQTTTTCSCLVVNVCPRCPSVRLSVCRRCASRDSCLVANVSVVHVHCSDAVVDFL